MTDGPFRDGKVWVHDPKCETCIFRPGNLMHLAPGARDQMVADCLAENTTITCHETLDGPKLVCRGLYDLHRADIMPLRLADAYGIIAMHNPQE